MLPDIYGRYVIIFDIDTESIVEQLDITGFGSANKFMLRYAHSFTNNNKLLLQDRLYDLESLKPDKYARLVGRSYSVFIEYHLSSDYKYVYSPYNDSVIIYYADKLFTTDSTGPTNPTDPTTPTDPTSPTNPVDPTSLTATMATNGVRLNWMAPTGTQKLIFT